MDTESEQPPESVVAEQVDQDLLDEYDLAKLGHGQALSRKFDLVSILALAFCVLGTWSTFAQVCFVRLFAGPRPFGLKPR